jgi:hypothetical protein
MRSGESRTNDRRSCLTNSVNASSDSADCKGSEPAFLVGPHGRAISDMRYFSLLAQGKLVQYVLAGGSPCRVAATLGQHFQPSGRECPWCCDGST